MTAFTLTDTLSREITSWGGTSSTTTRRSMRTICCTIGTSRKNRALRARAFVLAQDAHRRVSYADDEDYDNDDGYSGDHGFPPWARHTLSGRFDNQHEAV